MNSDLYKLLVDARMVWNQTRNEDELYRWMYGKGIYAHSKVSSLVFAYCRAEEPIEWMQRYFDEEYSNMEPSEIFNSAMNLARNCGKSTIKSVKDWYIRAQILRLLKGEKTEEIISRDLKRYCQLKDYLSSLRNENEAAEYISGLDDNDIKIGLLGQIKDESNRDSILHSVTNVISPDIKPLVLLSQKMIRELFEDSLGNKFDEKKRSKMDIVFARTNFQIEEMENEKGGISDIDSNISINSNDIRNLNRMIGLIIHEYGHKFMNFDLQFEQARTDLELSEGSCDLLADLAINHYIQKHNGVVINGKSVRLDYPYQLNSAYLVEDGWPRAILAGLKNKGQNPLEAFSELLLGDKRKYEKICFGKATELDDPFEGVECTPSLAALYNSQNLSFETIDPRSVYYKRNWIFPLFKMKNKEPEAVDLKNSNREVMAMRYLESRKIYNMSREEMEDFANFFLTSVVLDNKAKCDEFVFKQLSKLSDEETKQFSFELLYNLQTL